MTAWALDHPAGRLVVCDGRIGDPGETVELELVTDGEVRPGLVNAHDHLHRNHFPRLGEPPYEDAYAWGLDLHRRWQDDIEAARGVPRRQALLFGALKNLLGGATTVVHHDPWELAFDEAFPVRVPRVRVAHSLGFERDLAGAVRGDEHTRDRPLCLHLAEGIGAAARDEVQRAEALGLLGPDLLAVHLVGLGDGDLQRLLDHEVAMAWCPSSNRFLFGRTAPRGLVAGIGRLVLGSDSLLTGDGTLLDELRLARGMGFVDEGRLLTAVGEGAAAILGVEPPSLEPGSAADLVVLRCPLFEARAKDLELVTVGGVPRLAHPRHERLLAALGVDTEFLVVGGEDRLVQAPLASVATGIVEAFPEAGRIFG